MKNLKKSIAKKAAKLVLKTVRMSNGTASIFDITNQKNQLIYQLDWQIKNRLLFDNIFFY